MELTPNPQPPSEKGQTPFLLLGAVVWPLLNGWSVGSAVVGVVVGVVISAAQFAVWPQYRRAMPSRLGLYVLLWLVVLAFAWVLSDDPPGAGAVVLLAPALILVAGCLLPGMRERQASD